MAQIVHLILNIANGIIKTVVEVLFYVWWLLLPIVLFVIFWELRLYYIRLKFIKAINWTTLEIKIPRDVLKSPKAMEQVFSALHGIYAGEIKKYDKFIAGKIQLWFSMEIVGNNGGTRFFVRAPTTPVDFRNLIESAIFSQYPEAEIEEIDDYTEYFPSVLPDDTYDLWGTELILAKESPYPIKTYQYFEETQKEKRLDPISGLVEAFSKLKSDEMAWIQILIKPIGEKTSDYKKKGQELVDKLLGRKKEAPAGFLGKIFEGFADFISNLFRAWANPPEWSEEIKKEKGESSKFSDLSHGQQQVVKAVEAKLGQLSFDTIIRFVYIDKKNAFTRSNIASVLGVFKQFNTENLNAFKPNADVSTAKGGWLGNLFPFYKKSVEYGRKRKIYDHYRFRFMLTKPSVFSVEELATLYHVPSMYIEAPKLKRIEAKKSEPPTELPVIQ